MELVRQHLQDARTTPIVARLVKCVNDEDENTSWGARKFANQVVERSALRRLWCQVWVVTKSFCNDVPKRGKMTESL